MACRTMIGYLPASGAAPAAPPAASAPPAEALHRLEAVAAPRDAAEAAQTPGFGLEVRQRPDAPAGAAPKGKGAGSGSLLSRAEVAKRASAAAGPLNPGADPKLGGAAAAEAALAADLALLQRQAQAGGDPDRGAAGASDAGRAGDEAAAWRPPEGQKGDGRTSLNDLLGY